MSHFYHFTLFALCKFDAINSIAHAVVHHSELLSLIPVMGLRTRCSFPAHHILGDEVANGSLLSVLWDLPWPEDSCLIQSCLCPGAADIQ